MPEEIIFEKKEQKEAFQKSKELEKEKLTTNEELVNLYKENMQRSEELKKLLKKEWFMHDSDAKGEDRKSKKQAIRRKNL